MAVSPDQRHKKPYSCRDGPNTLSNTANIDMKKQKQAQTQNLTGLLQQAFALHQQGQLAEAKVLYEQVLAQQPRNFDALHLSGIMARQSQQSDLAVELLSKAVAIKPNYAPAYANLGKAFQALNRHEEAVANYDKAIAIKSDDVDFHYNRGNALRQLRRYEDALASLDKAIAIKPDYAECHYNRGNALRKLQRYEDALGSYDRAVAIKPDYPEAYLNYGIALQELKRYEDALASFDKAIAIKLGYAEAYSNRGAVLQQLKRNEDALTSYDKAIALKTDYVNAYWNKSLALLLLGQFDQGWPLYEWRLKTKNFTQPLWLGTDSLAGKTILLHAEQGLGDTLQFCRYAQLVHKLGATVVLEVPPSLMGLLAGLPGVDVLLEADQALPAFDYHCPLMSLPLAFKTDLTNIPHPAAYLHSTPSKREAWSQRLGPKTKPRVGLVWSGNTEHKNDHNRSLPLAELLQHLPDTFEYVSLQKEVRPSDQEALAASKLRHFGEALEDFTDTAALCDCVDVVVSVDTSVAHLAGALGRPTWVLLPHAPDWRWLLDREDSPWYACVKLYRQGEDRQWAGVLGRVARDLGEVLRG
jgi:tetratricopeptide (TPR) repeat protein